MMFLRRSHGVHGVHGVFERSTRRRPLHLRYLDVSKKLNVPVSRRRRAETLHVSHALHVSHGSEMLI